MIYFRWFDTTPFSHQCVYLKGVINPNVPIFQSNCAEGLHLVLSFVFEVEPSTCTYVRETVYLVLKAGHTDHPPFYLFLYFISFLFL